MNNNTNRDNINNNIINKNDDDFLIVSEFDIEKNIFIDKYNLLNIDNNILNISKILQKRLEMYLKVFAAVTSPKQLFKHHLLYSFYNIILSKPDTKIVSLALDCILAYKSDSIVLYTSNLRAFLDEKSLRNELVTFDISMNSEVIQGNHRLELIPLVCRLIYGRFLMRTKSTKSGRDSSTSK